MDPVENKIVAGIDEAGRGALAGPVVACAVVVEYGLKIEGVRDSKQLSPIAREKFYQIITKHSGIWWGIGTVSEKVIDRINIKNAAELAMEKALKTLEKKMGKKSDLLIIDGNQLKNKFLKERSHKLVIKGDSKVFVCSLASIIAKVERDRIMQKLNKKNPEYNFAQHKGYGTREHFEALKSNGISVFHRKSFYLGI